MPTYEYLCEKCEHEFERDQRITDDPVKTCPKCRSRKVKRLISRTSFVLRGGGWYNDLYSSSNGKNAKSDSDSSTGDSASAKADTSSDSTAAQSDSGKSDKKDAKSSKDKGTPKSKSKSKSAA